MLREIQLGWIDYSNEHRNKVMSVLQALATPEAVDELGIGLIRDGFADLFFPGTSTIQTRAKYFFIVPYILMELERSNIKDPKLFLQKLHSEEIGLIERLKETSSEGIIGARAGKKLKRKPSSIYWSGLRTFEIFKQPVLSLDGYAKEYCKRKQRKELLKASGYEKEGLTEDDQDAISGEFSTVFWRCLFPEKDWREHVTIDLTPEEAAFLKERIMKSEATKQSLFAFMLQSEKFHDSTFESIDPATLPEEMRDDFTMATNFSSFIFGAIIRYNVILSNGENEEATQKWEEWKNSDFVKVQFAHFDYREMFRRLNLTNAKLRQFIKEWKEAVLTNDEDVIDQVIIKREINIKGRERAKLQNSKVYAYKDGDWFGGKQRLQYRFPDAKKIIADINDGLEKA